MTSEAPEDPKLNEQGSRPAITNLLIVNAHRWL